MYLEYHFTIEPLQPASEILIAELAALGFESFVELEDGIQAYIQKESWRENILDTVTILGNPEFRIAYHLKEIPKKNWNHIWERNFEPIQVGKDCVVRAPFHEKPHVKFDIVIEPKMSFGTGHHETTYLMLQYVLAHDFREKSVLDMGSGTGVLAILCEMKGASEVDAVDIDHWCYLNAVENIEKNQCHKITAFQGDASLLGAKKYDVILANINRNILLQDIAIYAKCLRKQGLLFLSGFYEKDVAMVSRECLKNGLMFQEKRENNEWVAIKYQSS